MDVPELSLTSCMARRESRPKGPAISDDRHLGGIDKGVREGHYVPQT